MGSELWYLEAQFIGWCHNPELSNQALRTMDVKAKGACFKTLEFPKGLRSFSWRGTDLSEKLPNNHQFIFFNLSTKEKLDHKIICPPVLWCWPLYPLCPVCVGQGGRGAAGAAQGPGHLRPGHRGQQPGHWAASEAGEHYVNNNTKIHLKVKLQLVTCRIPGIYSRGPIISVKTFKAYINHNKTRMRWCPRTG